MNQKTVLTPMQLFFCAKLMDAVYYDYAYLAAMPDVQKEYALHEQETMEELEDQGMIERDFDDNVEMAEDLRELLTPVFLGEKEGRLDVEGKPSCRFHSKDGVITMTVLENGKITISGSSEGAFKKRAGHHGAWRGCKGRPDSQIVYSRRAAGSGSAECGSTVTERRGVKWQEIFISMRMRQMRISQRSVQR